MGKPQVKFHCKCKVGESAIIRIATDHLLKRKSDGDIEIEIVGKSKIASLNEEFMHKTGPTDVLSFPLPIICEADNLLGTIFLCRDIIYENSKEHDVTFEVEFEKDLTHGIDHLLGIHHK